MFSLCYFYLFLYIGVLHNVNSRCCLCRLTVTRRVSHELFISFRQVRVDQSLIFSCFYRISFLVIINYAQRFTFFVTFHDLSQNFNKSSMMCANPSGPSALHPVVSEDSVALSIVSYAVCPFVLLLLALVLSALIWFAASVYPFGIVNHFWRSLSFNGIIISFSHFKRTDELYNTLDLYVTQF
jgi:hypothetical protein